MSNIMYIPSLSNNIVNDRSALYYIDVFAKLCCDQGEFRLALLFLIFYFFIYTCLLFVFNLGFYLFRNING